MNIIGNQTAPIFRLGWCGFCRTRFFVKFKQFFGGTAYRTFVRRLRSSMYIPADRTSPCHVSLFIHVNAPLLFFKRLKFFYKFAVNIILNHKSRAASEQKPVFTQNTGSIPQIKDKQIISAGIKGHQCVAVQRSH